VFPGGCNASKAGLEFWDALNRTRKLPPEPVCFMACIILGNIGGEAGNARTWQPRSQVCGPPRLVRRRLGGAGGRVRLHARCYLWREGLLLDAGQFGRPQARARSPLTRP